MTKKVLEFPKLWDPPPPKVDVADQMLKVLDDVRRESRQRWRRDGRMRTKGKRLVITIGRPPENREASWLWALGARLLTLSESALDAAISLRGNEAKVLRNYLKATRESARVIETEWKGRRKQ